MTPAETSDAVHGLLGACGSAISMLWSSETGILRRLVLFFGGIVFTVVATPDLARRVPSLSDNLLALMLGVGSMMLLAKCFDTIQSFNLAKIVRDAAYKWAGLPAPTSPPKE